MPLGDDEIRKLAQSILERPEQLTADTIFDLIESQGRKPLNSGEAQCRAFASLFRTLLSDQQVQRLLRLAHERSQFETVLKTLGDRMKAAAETQNVTDDFFVARSIFSQITSAREAVAEEIGQLASNRDLEKKVWLLEQVTKILASLKCNDKFDVPTVRMRPIE